MSALSSALLVIFVIICAVIIFLVLLQNEEGDSLGGLFAGSSNSAFGSRSGNVLSRTTYIAVSLFFVIAFLLAFLNRSISDKGLSEEAIKKQGETSTEWWKNNDSKEDKAETKTSSNDGK